MLHTLRRLSDSELHAVRLGTDILHKCRIFSEIWSDYSVAHPLAGRAALTQADLKGKTVVTIHTGMMR